MKTDARVRYTKMVIKQCFFRLIRQKSISKITVKEICEFAQINRSTFYKYYADPYDLLEKLEEEAILGITQMIDEYPQKGLRPVLVTILRAIYSNRDFQDLAFYRHRKTLPAVLPSPAFTKYRYTILLFLQTAVCFSAVSADPSVDFSPTGCTAA